MVIRRRLKQPGQRHFRPFLVRATGSEPVQHDSLRGIALHDPVLGNTCRCILAAFGHVVERL